MHLSFVPTTKPEDWDPEVAPELLENSSEAVMGGGAKMSAAGSVIFLRTAADNRRIRSRLHPARGRATDRSQVLGRASGTMTEVMSQDERLHLLMEFL